MTDRDRRDADHEPSPDGTLRPDRDEEMQIGSLWAGPAWW